MKQIICIILLAVIYSCNSLTETDLENKSVQNVVNFYGGFCNREKGIEYKNGTSENFYELIMSQSDLIDSYAHSPELPASNIAYLFYSNLKQEQENYSQIRVKLDMSNGKTFSYSYSDDDLKEMEEFTPILQKVSDYIKAKEYAPLISELNLNLDKNVTVDNLKSFWTTMDNQYGTIDSTQLQGCYFFQSKEDGRHLVNLTGVMIRKKSNTLLELFIDKKSKQLITMNSSQ